MSKDVIVVVSIREGSQEIENAVKTWVQGYKGNRARATSEFATFILQACGITSFAIGANEIEHTGSDELKENADAIAKMSGLEDILGGKGGKKVKQNYREVIDKIIREMASAGQLDDGFFLEKIINLTIALSTSVVREFRKVATMSASQMSTSILVIVSNLNEMRERSSHHTSAGASGKTGKSSTRASAFSDQVRKASDSIKELLSHIDSIFQSIFTTRFRDVDSEIRCLVSEGVGRWMELYPSVFLSSTYLKYLAWSLSDKDPSVRIAAINAIASIYKDKKNAMQLQDFTDRFSERIQELMEDKDDAVVVAGTELVTMLVKEGHMQYDLGSQVFNLLSDPSPRLRAAASDLAASLISERGRQALGKTKQILPALKKVKGRGASKTFLDEECELAGVLSILQSLASGKEGSEHASILPQKVVHFVVSSLAHKLRVLSNWPLLVEWMLNDIPTKMYGESASINLARCFLSAVQSVINDGKGPVPKERKKASETARQEVTIILQKSLPELLSKYQADPELTAIITQFVPEMKIEIYSLRKHETALVKLLEGVKNSFFRHSVPACILACAQALSWCSVQGKDTTKDLSRSVLHSCVRETLEELQQATSLLHRLGIAQVCDFSEAYRQSNGMEEAQELFQVRCAVSRVAAILEASPSSLGDNEDAINGLRTILRYAAEGWDIPAQILFDAERSLFLTLLSQLSTLKGGNDDNGAGKISEERFDLSARMVDIINVNARNGHQSLAIVVRVMNSHRCTLCQEELVICNIFFCRRRLCWLML